MPGFEHRNLHGVIALCWRDCINSEEVRSVALQPGARYMNGAIVSDMLDHMFFMFNALPYRCTPGMEQDLPISTVLSTEI